MATVILQDGLLNGDEVRVTGTVDGVEVSVRVWKSHLDTLSTLAAKRAYVAAQLKAAAPAASVAVSLAGTVTV